VSKIESPDFKYLLKIGRGLTPRIDAVMPRCQPPRAEGEKMEAQRRYLSFHRADLGGLAKANRRIGLGSLMLRISLN